MRSIFTYPNNEPTAYIDPDYYCSEDPITSTPPPDGFAKRMYDMHNGIQYGGGPILGCDYVSHSKVVSYSKDGYFSNSQIDSSNLGMYDIWKKPLVEVDTELAQNHISGISYYGTEMQYNNYKRTGFMEISTVILTRDPNDKSSNVGTYMPWQMPHNTKYNVDWELSSAGSSTLGVDFYCTYDGSGANGSHIVRTAAQLDTNVNMESYYRFDQSKLDAQTVYLYGSVPSYPNMYYFPAAIECLSGATRTETSGNKVLTLTGGTQTISVAASDDWWWGRNPNVNPNAAVNPGKIQIGLSNDGYSTAPASNNPECKMPQTLTGYGDGAAGQGTVYTEPSSDPAVTWGLRPLFSDLAKTTRYTSTALTQEGYRVGGSGQSNTIFGGKIFSDTGGIGASTQTVVINLGYTDVPSGISPVPPAGNVDTTILNNIFKYISSFASRYTPYSGTDWINWSTGTVDWETALGRVYFPAYISLSDIGDWDRDPNNPTDHLYSGFDYENPRMCRLHRQTHDDGGSNPNMNIWYSWHIIVGGVPKAIYSTQNQKHEFTDIQNTFIIDNNVSDIDAYIQLPKYAGGIHYTHENDTINTLPANPNNTVTISDSEPAKYRLSQYRLIQPYVSHVLYGGNTTFKKRTGASTYENAAIFNEVFWEKASTVPAVDPNVKWPDISPAQNSAGYITQVGFGFNTDNNTGTNSAGLFTVDGPKIFEIASSPDTYTPPTPTPAELEDQWDTMDEWSTSNYSSTPKVWPDHIPPTSASITYNSPTIVNRSQNGIKYTRGSGHTQWRLEVEYPPMTPEDFKQYAAIAQAAHGQSIPFFFKLIGKDGAGRILWKEWANIVSTNEPRLLAPTETGDSIQYLGGFQSNEADVFGKGEVFIGSGNNNGFLHTTLSPQDANVYGEVKIRTSLPVRSPSAQWTKIYKDPFWAVVTLDSDNFEFSTDANGYYYVNVAFDLDTWKA